VNSGWGYEGSGSAFRNRVKGWESVGSVAVGFGNRGAHLAEPHLGKPGVLVGSAHRLVAVRGRSLSRRSVAVGAAHRIEGEEILVHVAAQPLAERRGDIDRTHVGGQLGGGVDDGEQSCLVEPAKPDGFLEPLLDQVGEAGDVRSHRGDAVLPAAPDHSERVVAHVSRSGAPTASSWRSSSVRIWRTLRTP
jgi:hypothetical protein